MGFKVLHIYKKKLYL